MWRLKSNQPAFEMVDGPFAGTRFIHGESYLVIPASMEGKFEQVEATGELVSIKRKVNDTAKGGVDAEYTSES